MNFTIPDTVTIGTRVRVTPQTNEGRIRTSEAFVSKIYMNGCIEVEGGPHGMSPTLIVPGEFLGVVLGSGPWHTRPQEES